MIEKSRSFNIDYPMHEPLVATTLTNGKPLRKEYKRSGGYGSQDKKDNPAPNK